MVQLRVQHLLFMHQLLNYHLALVYLLAHHLLDVPVLLPQHPQRYTLVLNLSLALNLLRLQVLELPLEDFVFGVLLHYLFAEDGLVPIESLNLPLFGVDLALAGIDLMVKLQNSLRSTFVFALFLGQKHMIFLEHLLEICTLFLASLQLLIFTVELSDAVRQLICQLLHFLLDLTHCLTLSGLADLIHLVHRAV